ncbi:ParB/RepB/Spo0J family partition protein [Lapidilactobacillus luobeiensis]|uniref:ParB/RepB/Spo0J family partition protein n=1 Tax=Lapidilactobacillus luobeiensis TaxID=2950371 RepID=UPI0021C4C61E|nr:ParB/RepB/Spo0J family partition protein [Lapidilactobacillus luobeiensis]
MAFFNRQKKVPVVSAKTEEVPTAKIAPEPTAAVSAAGPTPPAKRVQEVALKQIVPNRHQPRKRFADESISELAETIAAHGLLQPIILREYQPQQYEIIAGERRFRAVQALAWRQIPAIVEQMDAQESAEMAVIENLQREDLNSIDEAYAYQNLLEINGLTQAQLAERVGKSQSYIANKLRLLKLPEEAQQALANGQISPRHGRALLKLGPTEQAIVLKQILTDKLTVTQTDELIKRLSAPTVTEKAVTPTSADQQPTKSTRSASLTAKQQQHVGSADLRVAVNTVKQAIKLVEASGAKVAYHEALHGQNYQVTISVTVPEPPRSSDPKVKEEN